jgi:hypothetical protein
VRWLFSVSPRLRGESWFSDHGDDGDPPHPSPSRGIPDWRRLQRSHPKSSQIGVDFSTQASIGVDFRGFPSRSFVSFVVKGPSVFWLGASG